MNEITPENIRKAVAYYRVSNERQDASGLGLEVLEQSIYRYMKTRDIEIEKEFTEIESSNKNNRTVLKKALAYSKKNKTLLMIAKLERLRRNVAFISSLMKAKLSLLL